MVEFPALIYESPAKSYLRHWREHEGSDLYDFVSLLTAVGIVIGRRASVYNGRALYPNLYVVLEGPTGISRKTTAASRATRIIEAVDPSVITAKSINSAEGLIDLLKDNEPTQQQQMEAAKEGKVVLPAPAWARLLVAPDELTNIFRGSRRQATSNILPKLIEMHDSPDRVENLTRFNKTRGSFPTVALLSGSTAGWLAEDVNDGDVQAGVYNRMLIVSGTGQMRPMNPRPEPPDPAHYIRIIEYLRKGLDRLPRNGEGSWRFELSEYAEQLWLKSYEKWYATMDALSDRDRALRARLPDIRLKLALILAVMQGRRGVIDLPELECAIQFTDYSAETTAQLFGGLTSDKMGRFEKRVLNALKRQEQKFPDQPERWPMKKRELHAGTALNANEFNPALGGLVKAEAITWTSGERLSLTQWVEERYADSEDH